MTPYCKRRDSVSMKPHRGSQLSVEMSGSHILIQLITVCGKTRPRFRLGSQLACCARAKAVEAVKTARTRERQRKPHQKPITCPQFGPRGSVRYDARTYHLMSLDWVSLEGQSSIQGPPFAVSSAVSAVFHVTLM